MITHIIFLLTLTISCFADGAFYINNSNNLKIEDVKNNKVEDIASVIGKTYYIHTNNLSFTTSTNGESSLLFNNNITAKLNGDTKVIADSFEQVVQNIDNQPEIIKYIEDNLQLSLSEGELELIVNGNVTVGTMMTTVVPKSGKYFIKSDQKSTTVAVIEGEAKLLDTLSKKEVTLKNGELVVVVEAPKFSGRQGEVLRKQHLFNVRKMDEEESKFFSSALSNTQQQNNNIKFVIIDKKIVGIKIN
jgi:hypothetical protein